MSRSGAGDCGGQGLRVGGRDFVIEGRMGALCVVVCDPSSDHDPRIGQVVEHCLV